MLEPSICGATYGHRKPISSSRCPHSRVDTGQRGWMRLVTMYASAETGNSARSEYVHSASMSCNGVCAAAAVR